MTFEAFLSEPGRLCLTQPTLPLHLDARLGATARARIAAPGPFHFGGASG